jgi:hypothetical protein
MIRDLFSEVDLIQYIWLSKWSFIELREFNSYEPEVAQEFAAYHIKEIK